MTGSKEETGESRGGVRIVAFLFPVSKLFLLPATS